jgi:hypothetical protein
MQSLQSGDLEKAKALFGSIRELDPSGAVWVAVFMLFKAIVDPEWPSRLPLLWIALESIFGASDGREIRHQLAERVALLLETSANAKALYHATKKAYDWRSKTIHGYRLIGSDEKEGEEMMLHTEDILRASLVKILVDKTLRDTLNGGTRDEYLSELAFAERAG